MSKRKFRIPCLEAVAEAARKYVAADEVLSKAFQDLEEAKQYEKEVYDKALLSQGMNCVNCGKRFLPFPNDYSGCCSIGCRFA